MAKYCKYYGLVLYMDCLECEEKYCRRPKVKNKIVVGIDQSYKDTGISISMNGHIKTIGHCFTNNLCNNSLKRQKLNMRLLEVLEKVSKLSIKYDADVMVVIERIRLQSQGFINIDYIKSIGALNAMIVDTCMKYNFKVYSVDTRAWKSAVVGTSKEKQNKYGIDPKKWPTILWLIDKGFEESIKEEISGRKKKGVIEMLFKMTYNTVKR